MVIGARVYRYAYSQARVRSRLASIVSPQQWAYIVEAADLNNLIERMRASGLAFWLNELPRDPSPAMVERHFDRRARLFLERLVPVFPRSWHAAARWLVLLPQLRGLRLVLHKDECAQQLEEGSLLRRVAERPRAERHALLATTAYGRLLRDNEAIESRWYAEFCLLRPDGGRREVMMQRRFDRMLMAHVADVRALREEFRRRDPGGETGIEMASAQWRLRNVFAGQVRSLLASGDPYHGVFILSYALLEALQAEKARALLLAHAFGWRAAARFGEVA